jgi:transcriptional regulator with XRE-family HTH domain
MDTKPEPNAASPAMKAIADEINALRERQGLSRRQLAFKSGVHPTQVSQILLGHQNASVQRTAKILEALGAALLVSPSDEQTPRRIGAVDDIGRVMTESTIIFPGYVECGPNTPDFAPGEQLFMRAHNTFALDKLVQTTIDGKAQLVRCREIDGTRYLVTLQGHELRYTAERYPIMGIVYGSFRPM